MQTPRTPGREWRTVVYRRRGGRVVGPWYTGEQSYMLLREVLEAMASDARQIIVQPKDPRGSREEVSDDAVRG
jgi:hypothetical protein